MLNGPLRQYFSLYRAVSQRGRKKREMIDDSKNARTTPTRTHCKRSKPLPYSNPNEYDAPALEVNPAPSVLPISLLVLYRFCYLLFPVPNLLIKPNLLFSYRECIPCFQRIQQFRSRGYKIFFMLNSIEHEISNVKNIKKFGFF